MTPKNATAKQLLYRSAGNPPSTLPDQAISNCYPGLEFDFRNIWKRIFVGIVMHEADSYVMEVEDERYASLLNTRIVRCDGNDMTVVLRGPRQPGGPTVDLLTPANPDAAWFMEWSNSLSRVLHKAGKTVECEFTSEPSPYNRRPDYTNTQKVTLEIRNVFEPGTAVLSRELVQPGKLTESLCSPWQNDYRECACYYWASSRPDYVNITDGGDGLSVGQNWMQRRTPGTPQFTSTYQPDDRSNFVVFFSYDDLFRKWQSLLTFIVQGKDQEPSEP